MSMTRLKSGCPVLVFDIPKQIRGEIKKWVEYSKSIKTNCKLLGNGSNAP